MLWQGCIAYNQTSPSQAFFSSVVIAELTPHSTIQPKPDISLSLRHNKMRDVVTANHRALHVHVTMEVWDLYTQLAS